MLEYFEALLKYLSQALGNINSSLFDLWPVALTVGIALCFTGFKIFRFSVFIFGFIVGATIGLGIGDMLIRPWGGIVFAVIIGLLGGYGFLFIIRVAGLAVGVVLGGVVGVFLLGESVWVIPVSLISGICAFFLLRYFIMVSTSCWGALLAVGGFARLVHLPFQGNQDLLVIGEGILFAVGLGYQLFYRSKQP